MVINLDVKGNLVIYLKRSLNLIESFDYALDNIIGDLRN